MPKVDSLTKTDTTIVFTGNNFFTTDHVGKAKFMGIEANSVNVDSAT
jgi:phage major head subunit gpT-like protein